MVEYIAHIMISPLNQFIFGSLAGILFIRFTKTKQAIGKGLIIISWIWVLLCSQYWFSNTLLRPLEQSSPPIKLEDPQWHDTEAIWVLACYHFEMNELPRVSQFSDCSLERLVHAANMYHAKPSPIYLTGENFVEFSNQNHSDIAAEFLMTMGVNENHIIPIPTGTNTKEEVEAIKTKIKEHKVAIVSSATHALRVSALADSSNIDYVFVPVDYEAVEKFRFRLNFPSISSLKRAERAMYEYAALVRDRLYD